MKVLSSDTLTNISAGQFMAGAHSGTEQKAGPVSDAVVGFLLQKALEFAWNIVKQVFSNDPKEKGSRRHF